ncbi:MAG: NrtA/SsuA/CpmA family ABC transporter substrate-binding protein [Burkholderiaceae bacterium]|nr:NrtA/SsuA/CpmA family ABC transporter substrate-binding protein [Burkholderiaceae bacterium]
MLRFFPPYVTWVLLGLVLGLRTISAGAEPLRVAIADLPYFTPALVAGWQNFFAAEGVDVQVVRCVNGKRCLQHLIDKEVDVATVADTPIMVAVHGGVPFDILATMTTSRDNTMVARKDRGINTPADLRGKRIGFVRGTSGHYFTDTFLTFNGITPDQVTLVELDSARAPQQIAAGDVDAAGLYQPHGPTALGLLGDKGLTLISPRLYTATMNLVSRPGVNDGDLSKLLRAIKRSIDYIQEDEARAKSLVAQRLKIDPTALNQTWDALNFRLSLGQSLLTTLEAESRWARRSGLVAREAAPDFLVRMRPGPLRTVDPTAITLIK